MNIQNKNPFITFIIPTIGRGSLINSINSIINQNDDDWYIIIVFDGIKNNLPENFNYKFNSQKKIKILEIPKVGKEDLKNNAGLVRNIGIQYASSEWIGFLDDDDYISVDYICSLKKEINLVPNIDLCLFRMGFDNGCILPSKFDKNIIRNKVGISFSVKRHIFDKIKFINSPFEDYIFLKEIQKYKYKILISSYVCYFVKTEPYKFELYPKIII
jgi:glycosyltransferase involved in cell wall biosynthesis